MTDLILDVPQCSQVEFCVSLYVQCAMHTTLSAVCRHKLLQQKVVDEGKKYLNVVLGIILPERGGGRVGPSYPRIVG